MLLFRWTDERRAVIACGDGWFVPRADGNRHFEELRPWLHLVLDHDAPEGTDVDIEALMRGGMPTQAEPEAAPDTQAEELKPEEETSAESEASGPELVGQSSIDDLVNAGIMLTEDERAMRIGILAGKIESHAQERIAARYDANARADILRDIQDYINRGALGLEITDAQREAFQRANEINAWITAQETHARLLRERLPSTSLDMLRAYDLERAGWPLHRSDLHSACRAFARRAHSV